MINNIERVKMLVEFENTSEKFRLDTTQHFKKFPKLYDVDETWVLKSYLVRQESLSQIDSWLDELHESDNSISLPHIPYDYHQLYAELVRRERL